MRSWPTMPMPLPSMQRSPIVMTGSPREPGLRRHARADARERPDRRARADRDAAFAEDHRRRERDHAAVAERVEACAPGGVADRSRRSCTTRSHAACTTSPASASDLVPQSSIGARIRRIGSLDGQRRDRRSASACSTTSRRATELFEDVAAARARRSRRVGSPRSRVRVRRRSSARAAGGQRARQSSRAFDDAASTKASFAIIGPSISDNALIVAPLCDAARDPGDQLHRRRAHALAVDVPLPGRFARRGAAGARGAHGRARASARAAVVFDQSPVGRRYAECFEAARARLGLEVTGTASISPLAEDADDAARRACAPATPTCSSTSGSACRRARSSLARESLGWDVPVLANSALMFGYARPDWRDGYAGWEYIDTIADDNQVRAALRERSPRAAGGPIGCAAYDMGRLLGEGDRPGRAPHPGRDRRRAAPGEAAARRRAATTAR